VREKEREREIVEGKFENLMFEYYLPRQGKAGQGSAMYGHPLFYLPHFFSFFKIFSLFSKTLKKSEIEIFW